MTGTRRLLLGLAAAAGLIGFGGVVAYESAADRRRCRHDRMSGQAGGDCDGHAVGYYGGGTGARSRGEDDGNAHEGGGRAESAGSAGFGESATGHGAGGE